MLGESLSLVANAEVSASSSKIGDFDCSYAVSSRTPST